MDERRDFDCLDFKLMLTSLVDGTAPSEGRQTAERHALRCPTCLKLLEEAEATDFMLRLSARAEPAELPSDFADRVVAAARSESESMAQSAHSARRLRRSSWREGGAWLAAAAGVVIALVVWSGDRAEGWRGPGSNASMASLASPVFSGVRDLNEEDRRGAAFDDDGAPLRAEALAALLTALAETLDEIGAADADDSAALDTIAERVRSEELAARSSLLRLSLSAEHRTDLQAAEAALIGVSAGCLDAVRVQQLQANLRELGLAQRLRELAKRLPRSFAAA